jgi:hypothetical protein
MLPMEASMHHLVEPFDDGDKVGSRLEARGWSAGRHGLISLPMCPVGARNRAALLRQGNFPAPGHSAEAAFGSGPGVWVGTPMASNPALAFISGESAGDLHYRPPHRERLLLHRGLGCLGQVSVFTPPPHSQLALPSGPTTRAPGFSFTRWPPDSHRGVVGLQVSHAKACNDAL